jgi:hypothetical protein
LPSPNKLKADKKEAPMNEMLAYCGLDCLACGAFIATRDQDDAKRKEVAKLWSQLFRADIKPEDIHCTGCRSEQGSLFSHCHVCEIRKCGRAKKITNCALCPDYACEKLNAFFKMAPEAQAKLAQVRAEL